MTSGNRLHDPDFRLEADRDQRVYLAVMVEEKLLIVRVVAPADVDRETAAQLVVGIERAADAIEEPAGPLHHLWPQRLIQGGIVDAADNLRELFGLGQRCVHDASPWSLHESVAQRQFSQRAAE